MAKKRGKKSAAQKIGRIIPAAPIVAPAPPMVAEPVAPTQAAVAHVAPVIKPPLKPGYSKVGKVEERSGSRSERVTESKDPAAERAEKFSKKGGNINRHGSGEAQNGPIIPPKSTFNKGGDVLNIMPPAVPKTTLNKPSSQAQSMMLRAPMVKRVGGGSLPRPRR